MDDRRDIDPSHVRELFVVLEPFQPRVDEISSALSSLTTAASEGPLMRSVRLFYRRDTDVALLSIVFDRRTLTQTKLDWVLSEIQASSLQVLDPYRLAPGDREAFYARYLPLYATRVEQSSPGLALAALGRKLGLMHPTPDPIDQTASYKPNQRAALLTAGGKTPPPIARLSPITSSGRRLGSEADSNNETIQRPDVRRVAARLGSQPPLEDAAFDDASFADDETPKPRGKRKRKRLDRTIPGTANAYARTRASAPIAVEPAFEEPPIRVRFLRGEKWSVGRLRSLDLTSAHIAASSPPRVNDDVHISISLDELCVVARGSVREVSSQNDGTSGTAGFTVDFVPDATTRKQLAALLRRAKDSGVELEPPPARRSMRYPVSWPVTLQTPLGQVAATALDISRDGMFLSPKSPISGTDFEISLELDEPGVRVSAVVRIARRVSAEEATARGLEAGIGVELTEMSSGDRLLYVSFLERVAQRTVRQVMVAATPSRATQLVQSLTAAGYVVTSGSDPRVLVRLAELDGTPPDIAVFDDALGDGEESRWLRQVLQGRGVPCVAISRESGDRARSAVDAVLEVD
jgi:hypothetical protein